MNVNNLLPLIVTRSDELLLAWFLLAFTGLAMLAVLATSAAARANPAFGRIFALGWLFFSATHLMSMMWILKQWATLARTLQEAPSYKLASEAIRADLASITAVPDTLWVLPFHLAFDAFVLIAIWWLSRKASPLNH